MAEIIDDGEWIEYYEENRRAQLLFACRISDLCEFIKLNYPDQIPTLEDGNLEEHIIWDGLDINIAPTLKVNIFLKKWNKKEKATNNEFVFWYMKSDGKLEGRNDPLIEPFLKAMNEFNESLMDFYTRENNLLK